MKITMAHGSGGKTSAELMESVFGKHFKNSVLDKMEDAAVLDINGKVAYSTDSFVVTPVIFKGGDIGKLCVCGTVNDLLMMGAEPKYLTCGFILEEGLEVDTLDQIVASMAAQAKAAGVTIVAGDTKVVEGSGGLYINTSGIGIIPEGRDVSAGGCKPGDKILLSGNLGDHHACILSARMEIENDIKSDCGCLKDITDALFDGNIDVKTMRDVTRGGLGTILNEIADTSGCRIELEEEAIPVDEEVRGFADILGLDPLYMGNEGKMIAIVPSDQAEEALRLMRDTEHGKDAAVIGQVKEGNGTFITTRLGGSRVLDVLYGEGLPRIC
ncbi:hydrogenase expression/formation protein HypE [Anaerovorax odorimutans]|uniref:Hydrogenase expression/formation protein HypE n=1 Tax=Anaerovorax odorimutans TaxID=109327 RepID=A0ABT1RT40_9FIRM|nr:hydrogenase expression/formation protein HypE [Anaerovorax odorimutans]MCQ4638342.1 hydrogenase expression/formation protein HypE [Anaerovorax odorimutans]